MLRSFIHKSFAIVILTSLLQTFSLALTAQSAQVDSHKSETFIGDIAWKPLIFSNHDLSQNSLQGSVYELLNKAESSILIFSFTFSDPEVIRIINQKASVGIDVQLVIDRDHFGEFYSQLHPLIKLGTRKQGEGHVHHKIMVIDHEFIWLGSANFTPSSYMSSKNLAIGFFSPEIGGHLYQEALDIVTSNPRKCQSPLSCLYGNQLLELYVLPHNAPESPRAGETKMNEMGKQKLISLIDNAKHSIKISMNVWTYKDASRAIIKAMQRGVKVDIVVGNATEEAVRLMIQNGIQIKQGHNLHYKFMLVDHKILLNGSPNWSMNTFSRSDESFIVLYDLTEEQLKMLEGPFRAAGLPPPIGQYKITNQSIFYFGRNGFVVANIRLNAI